MPKRPASRRCKISYTSITDLAHPKKQAMEHSPDGLEPERFAMRK